MKPLRKQSRNTIFSSTLKAAALLGVALGSTLFTERAASGQCPHLSSIHDSQKEVFPNLWVTHVSVTTQNRFNVTVTLKGSGILVSPHVVLVPANMIFQRADLAVDLMDENQDRLELADDQFIGRKSDYSITPAASIHGGVIHAPFGSRVPAHRMISSNFKPENSNKSSAKYKWNWGAMQFCVPFTDLGTGMPVKFGKIRSDNTKRVDVGGYRRSDLAMLKKITTENVVKGDKRWIDCNASSVTSSDFSNMLGGAGAWRSGTSETDLIGLYTYVSEDNDCTVKGPLFNDVGLRADSIREIMQFTPNGDPACVANQVSISPLPINELLYHVLNQQPEMLLPLEQLNLSTGGEGQSDEYSYRTMQVIEHTFYEWLEYPEDLMDPESPRSIRLLEPEDRWLEVEEAQALLSASRNWVIFNPPTLNPVEIEVDETIPVANSMTTYGPEDEFEDQDEEPIDEVLELVEEAQFDPADLNQDGSVNGADLGMLLGQWGNQGGSGDLNGNGLVEGSDLGMLLGSWR